MKPFRTGTGRTGQKGMVLLLCLIFMTSLTLLGLSATTDTITQRQLANNLLDAERTRQAGHLAMQWAENWLLTANGPAPGVCNSNCSGFYAHSSLAANIHNQPFDTWISLGYEVGLDPETGSRLASLPIAGVNPPIWMIEHLHHSPAAVDGNTPELDWYRILVRTSGESVNSVTILEGVVSKNWGDPENNTEFSTRLAWQELR